MALLTALDKVGQERKENRRFLGLPLNIKELIDHPQLCHFRRDLTFSQLVNILVYILHHFYGSGGTGLGLSIVYGLIRKLGGTVNVVSVQGKGTEFEIDLLIHQEET